MIFNKTVAKICILISVLFIFSATAYTKAHDQYGFGNREFLIQSALEAGKSTRGIWDLPGTKNFFKRGKWKQVQIWARDKGKDRKDRLFKFTPAGGSAEGRYFIKYAKEKYWGVNYIGGTGKVEARFSADHFELKHLGNGRWKIYVDKNTILAIDNMKAKNGAKIVAVRDSNSKNAQWVFFNARTNKSFIPRMISPRNGFNSSNNGKSSQSLESALGQKRGPAKYFTHVSASQFRLDNRNNIMKIFYEGYGTADQWNHILDTVKAAKYNRDTGARREIYNALNTVSVKKGSVLLNATIKPRVKKGVAESVKSERDAIAKKYLMSIENKFQ